MVGFRANVVLRGLVYPSGECCVAKPNLEDVAIGCNPDIGRIQFCFEVEGLGLIARKKIIAVPGFSGNVA